MKSEKFNSSFYLVYIATFVFLTWFVLGDFAKRPQIDLIIYCMIVGTAFLVLCLTTIHTYIEIQDNRTLINSGYRFIGKDTIDIFDIKYIYRFPNFILKWYGSRMVFYIQMPDGKLRQSALREVNYSNDTLRSFLKRIKKIKPSIELDPEYEKFLQEKLWLEDASENTVESVEARLQEKGETWE